MMWCKQHAYLYAGSYFDDGDVEYLNGIVGLNRTPRNNNEFRDVKQFILDYFNKKNGTKWMAVQFQLTTLQYMGPMSKSDLRSDQESEG